MAVMYFSKYKESHVSQIFRVFCLPLELFLQIYHFKEFYYISTKSFKIASNSRDKQEVKAKRFKQIRKGKQFFLHYANDLNACMQLPDFALSESERNWPRPKTQNEVFFILSFLNNTSDHLGYF